MKRFNILMMLLLPVAIGIAQVRDNQLWTSMAVRADLNRKLRVEVEEQLRFGENIAFMNVTFTEFGVRYRFSRQLFVRGLYRYSYRPNDFNRHRLAADVIFRWSQRGFPVRASYRLRLQNGIEDYTNVSRAYLRNKVSVEYNLSKLVDPYLSFETYFRLNQVNAFTTNRYAVGLDWNICKPFSLDTFFMVEDDFGRNRPRLYTIIGVGGTYRFRR